jgi:hypothetical protein
MHTDRNAFIGNFSLPLGIVVNMEVSDLGIALA